jgi:dipeptidyl aminopeptidase/acylaminoacyl peptidase
MAPDQERLVRRWLETREPGDAPSRLRTAVAEVPFVQRGSRFPFLEGPPIRLPLVHVSLRPVVLGVLVLAALLALIGAGYLVLRPPFPPRGLIAYVTSLQSTGSSGIRLVAADGSETRAVTKDTPNVFEHSPRWSTDGKTLLFARNTELDPFGSCPGVGSIVLYDVATAAERVIATGLQPIDTVEWSPSGDRVAYLYPPAGCGAPAELGVVDVATGKITTTLLGEGIWQVRWAGDSVAPARTVESVPALPGQPVPPSVVPSADGRYVATFALPGRAVTSHLTVGPGSASAGVDLGAGGAPSWSPDGSALAFIGFAAGSSEDGVNFRDRLAIATAGTWQVRTLADVMDPDVVDPLGVAPLPRLLWTPDGRSVYWIDTSGAHVVDVASSTVADIPGLTLACDDLQWQPILR